MSFRTDSAFTNGENFDLKRWADGFQPSQIRMRFDTMLRIKSFYGFILSKEK